VAVDKADYLADNVAGRLPWLIWSVPGTPHARVDLTGTVPVTNLI
jgi:hypothetical protein